MFLLQPLLDFVHFLRTTFYYIWGISIHIGRGIFFSLCYILAFLRDLLEALVIVGDELYKFSIELNSSISLCTNYIGSSTNSGIAAVNDALVALFHSIANALRTSNLHTRLLATKLCSSIKNFFHLICGALSLISDAIWWIILLIPRLIAYVVVGVADFFIFGFDTIMKAIIYAVSAIVDDVFKIAIGLVVLFVVWKKRHRIRASIISCLLRIKRVLRLRIQLIANRWRSTNQPRFGSSRRMPIRTSPLVPVNRSSLNETKSSDQQHCVVCRDNPKSVLLWPCRHLCLCEECADRMTNIRQQNISCPLCRSDVEFSLSIYT